MENVDHWLEQINNRLNELISLMGDEVCLLRETIEIAKRGSEIDTRKKTNE